MIVLFCVRQYTINQAHWWKHAAVYITGCTLICYSTVSQLKEKNAQRKYHALLQIVGRRRKKYMRLIVYFPGVPVVAAAAPAANPVPRLLRAGELSGGEM